MQKPVIFKAWLCLSICTVFIEIRHIYSEFLNFNRGIPPIFSVQETWRV